MKEKPNLCFFFLGAPWPAEWVVDEFAGNRSWCGGLFTAEKGFTMLVSFCLLSHCAFMRMHDYLNDQNQAHIISRGHRFVQTYPSINILRLLCLHREPSLRSEESFSLTDRRLSSDSHKPSSGEVSPYDNNSPVLSDRPRFKYTEDGSLLSDRVPRQDKLRDQSKDNSGSTSPTLSTNKGEQNSFLMYKV